MRGVRAERFQADADEIKALLAAIRRGPVRPQGEEEKEPEPKRPIVVPKKPKRG